jgi:hypothetical protein
VFTLLEHETVEKPAIRMLSLVSNPICAFRRLRQQFYWLDGIRRTEAICARFPKLCFCWPIWAVLDEAECQRVGVRQFLLPRAEQIDDEDISQSVVAPLQWTSYCLIRHVVLVRPLLSGILRKTVHLSSFDVIGTLSESAPAVFRLRSLRFGVIFTPRHFAVQRQSLPGKGVIPEWADDKLHDRAVCLVSFF